MAGQTRKNMQQIAATVAAMCSSKESWWTPWNHTHSLSEVHIESYFGLLRGQSPSSELTPQSYWLANARLARKMGTSLGDLGTEPPDEPALSADKMRECAKHALASALWLVSHCSDWTTQALEKTYRAESAMGFFDQQDDETNQEDMFDDDNLELENPASVIEHVLTEIEEEAAEEFADPDAWEKTVSARKAPDPDASLPDGADLIDLTTSDADPSNPTDANQKLGQIFTLRDAIGASSTDIFSGLWQLSVFLRCGTSGMDSKFLKKAELLRKKSRSLNWHQTLEHDLKCIREEEDDLLAGQRGSRIAKWIESGKKLRDDTALQAPERIQTGSIVILHLGTDARPTPALVLTVWPDAAKPKPCAQPVGLSRVKTFRAVLLQNDQVEGNILVPTDHTWRYGPTQVLGILDVAAGSMASGKFALTQESLDVWSKLQSMDLEPIEIPKPHRLLKKAKAKAKPRKNRFAKISQRLKKMSKASEKKVEFDPGAGIEISCDEIRRSAKGRGVIKNVMAAALDLDALFFSEQPLFDQLTSLCTLKACKQYSLKSFLDQAPRFFEINFFNVRNGVQYGRKVHEVLARLLSKLRSDPPCRKELVNLLREIHSAKLEGQITI